MAIRDDDHRLEVEFNDVGQTIGTTKSYFGTRCGKIARNHISPHYATWKKVPLRFKDEVWKYIKNEFVLPEVLKPKAMDKVHLAWKKSKGPLRLICELCRDLDEMRAMIPNYIKKEDWELFVVMVSKEEDWIARVRGHEARDAVKALHTTGRGSIASVRDEMEKEIPTGLVTRTDLFLATHEYQEIPKEDLMNFEPNSYEVTSRNKIRQVRELNETEKYRNESDLDRDAVAEVGGS